MPSRPPRAGHSWESQGHAWESEGLEQIEGWALGGDTDFEEESVKPIELSAKDFCVALYYAGKSGLNAAVLFGYKPNSSSGHYQRHLDPGNKAYNADSYMVDLPSYCKASASRCLRSTPMLLPHEILAKAMESDQSLGSRLEELKADLPDCFWVSRSSRMRFI